MANIDKLAAELDSLLNDINPDGDKKTKEDTNEDDWNLEEEVSDYLSSAAVSEDKGITKRSTGPLFHSDILKVHTKPKPESKVSEEDESDVTLKNYDSSINFKNAKNNCISGKEFISNKEFAIKTIADLSKKVRDLSSHLAATQNKLRLSESKLLSLQESQAKKEEKPSKPTPEVSEDKISALEKQIKDLNDKLSYANTKVCESRNHVQQQKHEIKLLQKAITNEIGENVNLQTITSDGWRGRAQQIIKLQQKVNDLSEKLSQSNIPLAEKTASTILLLERNQDKEKISSLTSELDETKSVLNETKTKNDQARARVKVLVNELNVLKNKYETQCAKNEEDVKLVNTLTAKITTISQKYLDREKKLMDDFQQKIDSLKNEYSQGQVKIEQLKKIVIERDSKIEQLESTIVELKEKQKGEDRPPSSWSTFQDNAAKFMSNSHALPSTEVERLRLMELVTVLNKRLDEERKGLKHLEDQLRDEKHRCVKLETKCHRLELEKVGKGGSYNRRSSSATSNRTDSTNVELMAAQDRITLLDEKILALQSRLERLKKEKEEDARIYVRMESEISGPLCDASPSPTGDLKRERTPGHLQSPGEMSKEGEERTEATLEQVKKDPTTYTVFTV